MTGAFQKLNPGCFTDDQYGQLTDAKQLALVVVAENACVTAGTDGLLSPSRLRLAVATAWADMASIPPIIAAGFWHDTETIKRCPDCRTAVKVLPRSESKLLPGEHFICDYLERQLPAKGADDELEQWRGARKRHLHHRKQGAIRQEVRDRDRDLCRYCGVLTSWGSGDRKSKLVGQYDHVDPFSHDGDKGFGNTVENLVIACKGCNSVKKDRTPEEAGMLLRDPPPPYLRSQTRSGSSPVRNQIRSGLEPVPEVDSHALAREESRSQLGASSDLVPFANGASPNGRGGS